MFQSLRTEWSRGSGQTAPGAFLGSAGC